MAGPIIIATVVESKVMNTKDKRPYAVCYGGLGANGNVSHFCIMPKKDQPQAVQAVKALKENQRYKFSGVLVGSSVTFYAHSVAEPVAE